MPRFSREFDSLIPLQIMIKEITWQEIYEVWKNYLWLERVSPIESTSAMCFLNGYNMNNKISKPTFFGFFVDNILVGVNSGHSCEPNENYGKNYRSRGLFVFEQYRNLGIGKQLLLATAATAKLQQCSIIWSYPKYTSWSVYEKAGFQLASAWQSSETGVNAFAYCNL